MIRLHRVSDFLVLMLVVFLPFEFRFTFLGLSNLQWLFLAAAVASSPIVLLHWRELGGQRLVAAAGLLTLVFWTSAVLVDEFAPNAIAGAVRVTTGLSLLTIVIGFERKTLLLRVWCGTAIAASVYALVEYSGFFGSSLFRTEDFFLGTTRRLSGSFEYPNTAATFFAMSLPLVWLIPDRKATRVAGTFLLTTALVLTYSRGGALALLLSCLGWWLLRHRLPEWKPVAACVAIVVVIFGLASASRPLLVTRLTSVTSDNPISAQYELQFTGLRQRPDVSDQTSVVLFNDGQVAWQDTGPDQVVLMSRWYDIGLDSMLADYRTETVITRDVLPGESLTLEANFITPGEPGDYLLIWGLRSGPDWFSRMGVRGAIAEVEILRDGIRETDQRDLSHWAPRQDPGLDAQVSRSVLWRAAVRMFLDHPLLGVGPDNFRLAYGSYLGSSSWDRNIRSNSLYLELLATTGLAGLLAFLVVVGSTGWRWQPVSIALGVFLLHGLVDFFLMTTPIYFAFWILVGLSSGHPDKSQT